jgi:hypothetical protein
MAEPNENENQNTQDGISEDELKGLIGNALDEKLEERGFTSETVSKLGKLDILDSLDNLFESHKGEPLDKESLLGEIGKLVDEKLKQLPASGGNKEDTDNGKAPRTPKLRIFS